MVFAARLWPSCAFLDLGKLGFRVFDWRTEESKTETSCRAQEGGILAALHHLNLPLVGSELIVRCRR